MYSPSFTGAMKWSASSDAVTTTERACFPAAIAAATATVFAAFGVHIYTGGAYEIRTVVAMSVRTLVWVAVSVVAWRGPTRGEDKA